ncbi:short chain dehydrogenase [Neoasaia chiangmaiensis NBRC 101099]|uniref:Uncharacterized protein n=1 Tax=Neoasaia chiangmaiensis TaxID=320497 RepID=A0A1U9KQ62_9PROT|nr:TetR/AcrR family transcriptional regulator [Neoasaia chiangmaiensis]AQS87926.1 hypothetical protein A0U93_08200 [Neoasaia chiangmaiensis]GBR39068.1 short chain dehydrogenase [Neoasaia chiangmaiensis NBRC 101099]GEN15576.1 hypothetical protein NCH01_20070 [Neoasaia chiangmaiensis]
MTNIKSISAHGRVATRDRILDAAEQLLRSGETADFSMRDLAGAAGVSFATPFNYFGSKAAIMQALSARRIGEMERRCAAMTMPGDAVGDAAACVLSAVGVAVAVLLEEPVVNRHVIGSLGGPQVEVGHVAERSRALWAAALGDFDGVRPALMAVARAHLPDYLALGFRGCISFWVAGEIGDADLPGRARAMAAAVLLGFVRDEGRAGLLTAIGL